MKFYLGVTNNKWFNYLSRISPEDVNFWQPRGNSNFKVIDQGAPFLFKLKSPNNVIGGVGFLSSHTFLPINIAWDVFGNRNGCGSFQEFKQMILQYRTDKDNINPSIGCIVLTDPIFFSKEDWIDVSPYWNSSIVQGKSYRISSTVIGNELWKKVNEVLQKYLFQTPTKKVDDQLILNDTEWPDTAAQYFRK